MTEGVDYSYGRPNLDELNALGVRFVCRYLAPLPSGKVLLPVERLALHDHRLAIVLNWESHARDMLGGYGVGVEHAQEALRQADALGTPYTPIYFSCDFDATPTDIETVARYLDGCATVLGRARVGVYGKADVIDATVPAHAAYGWQTYAWSGGRISDRAHLLQYRNSVTLAGAQVDLDRTLKANIGAWEADVMWYKASWIPPFFAALDTIAPNRDKASDGTIGDLAHMTGSSGHNPDDTPGVTAERTDSDSRAEVRAADAGTTLRSPITMQQIVDAILAYRPDRDRLIYIIFNGYIWSANNGWKRATYTGTDKHRTHAHLSGHPDSDLDGRPWQSILNLGKDDDVDPNDPSPFGQQFTTEEGVKDGPWLEGTVGNQLQYLREDAHFTRQLVRQLNQRVVALSSVIESLVAAVNAGGGDLSVGAILNGVDEKLAALAAETRDAVADLGEGGAAQVRADAP